VNGLFACWDWFEEAGVDVINGLLNILFFKYFFEEN